MRQVAAFKIKRGATLTLESLDLLNRCLSHELQSLFSLTLKA